MTEQSNAELIAEANAVSTNDVVANPRRYRNLIGRLAERLEAADQRAAEYAAVVEKVRQAASSHWEYQTRREAKFGREGSSCVCAVCDIMRALATAPADALREHDAALIEGLADELEGGFNSETLNRERREIKRALREKARQRREEQS